jgi:hypothetical protein
MKQETKVDLDRSSIPYQAYAENAGLEGMPVNTRRNFEKSSKRDVALKPDEQIGFYKNIVAAE